METAAMFPGLPIPAARLLDRSSLAGLALARLFDLAIEHGKPIVTAEILRQIRLAIDSKIDNCVENDERDGWTNENVGDPLNDYPGDPLAKRIDNFLFLFGKSLPGRVTDFIRDNASPVITPAIRALVDPATAT